MRGDSSSSNGTNVHLWCTLWHRLHVRHARHAWHANRNVAHSTPIEIDAPACPSRDKSLCGASSRLKRWAAARSTWLAPESRGRVNGLFTGLFFIGGAIGAALSGPMLASFGWLGVSSVTLVAFAAAALVHQTRRDRTPS